MKKAIAISTDSNDEKMMVDMEEEFGFALADK